MACVAGHESLARGIRLGRSDINANFALDINIKRSFSWGFRLISKKNHRFNVRVFDIYVGKNVKV